jgi:hypothetical protein
MFDPPFFMKYTIEEHETVKEEFFDEYQWWIDVHGTTDYFSDNKPHPYQKLMNRALKPYIKQFIQQWKGDTSDWGAEWWFAQYTDNDSHDWHIHPEANFACVYMLELPDSSFVTELLGNPFEGQNVQEGDLIIFPNSWPHRSPPRDSSETKTVIAGNIVYKEVKIN